MMSRISHKHHLLLVFSLLLSLFSNIVLSYPDTEFSTLTENANLSKLDSILVQIITGESNLSDALLLEHLQNLSKENFTLHVWVGLEFNRTVEDEIYSINTHYLAMMEDLRQNITKLSQEADAQLLELAKRDLNVTDEYLLENETTALIEYASQKYPEIIEERNQELERLQTIRSSIESEWGAKIDEANAKLEGYSDEIVEFIQNHSGKIISSSSKYIVDANINVETLVRLTALEKVAMVSTPLNVELHPNPDMPHTLPHTNGTASTYPDITFYAPVLSLLLLSVGILLFKLKGKRILGLFLILSLLSTSTLACLLFISPVTAKTYCIERYFDGGKDTVKIFNENNSISYGFTNVSDLIESERKEAGLSVDELKIDPSLRKRIKDESLVNSLPVRNLFSVPGSVVEGKQEEKIKVNVGLQFNEFVEEERSRINREYLSLTEPREVYDT